MEGKDVGAIVLSSLSLLVSIATACLGFFYWLAQRKATARENTAKAEQKVADVKDNYRLQDVAFSVQQVGDALLHQRGTEHVLWDLLYHRQAAVNTAGGVLTRRELLQHMSKVDSFWDYVVDMHSRDQLPKFFHKDGGWLARADNYRWLFEPLFIANYCQFEDTPYLSMADDGTFAKRPKRYWYIQQLWAQLQPDKPQRDSTRWAVAFEQQKQQHTSINMQGIAPVLPPPPSKPVGC